MSTFNIVKTTDNVYSVLDKSNGFELERFSNPVLARDFVAEFKTNAELRGHYARNTEWTSNEDFSMSEPETIETTAEIETVKAVKAPKPVPTTGTSKSSQVRARIVTAKAVDETQDIVIAWVITELGMTKALAKTYVKGNWDKV
jgi:hypothetical protein